MQTVLVSGFAPFAGGQRNVSWDIARQLQGNVISGVHVQTVCLPCVFGQAGDVLLAAIQRLQPCLVLALGQDGERSLPMLERVALNLEDAQIPDNAGIQPRDRPIVPGAPAAYFTDLPLKTMREALLAQGHACGLSLSAGSYVCNHVFYRLLHEASAGVRWSVGFVHLPPSLEVVRGAALVRCALAAALAVADAGTEENPPPAQ